MLQQWSSSQSPPDVSWTPFSSSLTTTVFSQRSMRRFEASPRRAAPKGQPSSLVQHRIKNPYLHVGLLSAFVTHNVALLMSCPPVAVEARTRRPTHAHRLLRKFDADRWRYDAPPADRALRTRAGDGTPSSGCVRRGGGSRCAPKRARRHLSRWI